MDFSFRKLPPESAAALRLCPVQGFAPYSPIWAPVYVFLKRNAKFVSVKAPLDFFTPEELSRLAPYESLFMPEFVELPLLFRSAGRRIRLILKGRPDIDAEPMNHATDVVLPPASYEISDAVLRVLGPLWGRKTELEPFFSCALSDAICDPLHPDWLREARDRNIETYEAALLKSGLGVFLALHLGHSDWDAINFVRQRIFLAVTAQTGTSPLPLSGGGELMEIIRFSARASHVTASRVLDAEKFFDNDLTQNLRLMAKWKSRLHRVEQEFSALAVFDWATLTGANGIIQSA